MKNENTYIQMTDENIEIIQKMSSDFHRLYAEAMKEYGEKELKLIDDTLNFAYRMIQVIGIVAGFGFTALGLVKQINLFILGEFFLLSSIVYGIYQIKKIYTSNLTSIQKSSHNASKVFQEKSQFFQEVIPRALQERKLDMIDFQSKLNVVDRKLLNLFSNKQSRSLKDEGEFLNVIIFFLVTGGILLLLSFLSK